VEDIGKAIITVVFKVSYCKDFYGREDLGDVTMATKFYDKEAT